MANKKCELPEGSFRTPHKGYEEVHVPALKPRPYGTGEKIVKISDIPGWAQPAFAGMQQLNRVQSKVYDTALFKPDNTLLCAPTGAGKTNVAMLTILHQIGLHTKDVVRRRDGDGEPKRGRGGAHTVQALRLLGQLEPGAHHRLAAAGHARA